MVKSNLGVALLQANYKVDTFQFSDSHGSAKSEEHKSTLNPWERLTNSGACLPPRGAHLMPTLQKSFLLLVSPAPSLALPFFQQIALIYALLSSR